MQVAFFGGARGSLRGVGQAVAVAVIAATVAACVAPFPPVPQAENADRVEEVLVQAFEDAGEANLDDVAVADMAVAGLASLAAIEPGLAVSDAEETVTLSLGSDPFYSFARPASDAAEDWADAVAKALIAAHEQSGPLQRAEPQRIYDSYMAGVGTSLGRGARYIPSEEFYGYLWADSVGLIDVTYAPSSEGLRVLSLDHTGRLAAAGLEVDDVIAHIDSRATRTLSQFEVFSLLRGPVESNVSLNVVRDGVTLPASIIVRRWIVAPRSYDLGRQGSVAVYKVPSLNEFAANELAASLEREARNAKLGNEPLTGLLLDLRGERQDHPNVVSTPVVTFGTTRLDWANVVSYIDFGFMTGPGGSPDAARRLASAFMSDGVVFRRQGRQDTANAAVEAGGTDPSGQLPLVVLVDSSTVGGAEMAAAGLQESGRALLIGTNTAGAGIVRKNVSLYNLGIINLAWAKAYAPSGYGIAGRGVMPDICTSIPGRTLEGRLTALRRGQGLTDPVARTRHIDPDDSAAVAAHRALCPAEIDSGDLAYELGLAVLQDLGLYARLMAQGAGS